MGLAIASELFLLTFTEMLKNISNQKLATDDIIVYGRTAEECQLYTDMILVTLNELGVTLSTDKCEFIKDEIKFYGHKKSLISRSDVQQWKKYHGRMQWERWFEIIGLRHTRLRESHQISSRTASIRS
jgi:hypothetical protein